MPGNIPLASPAIVESWPKPNYVNPVQRTWMPPYALVLQSATTFLVILRLMARCSKYGGGLGLDDALLVPSWLLSIGFTVVAVVAANDGLIDRHIWDIRSTRYSEMALNAWVAEFFFLIGTCCVKISVLLFYRRLVQRLVSRKWRLAIWGAITFTILWTAGLVLVLIFNCTPTSAYWKAYDPSWRHAYRCFDTKWINPLTGILCAVSDMYAVALPFLLLRPLQIAPRQKLELHVLFGLGVIVAAISAGRTWVMVKLGTDYDLTWVGFEVYAISLTEYEIGIAVACLPSLRALSRDISERARLRGSEGKLGKHRTGGPSPECEPEAWLGNDCSMYGGRNEVVIIGGHSKD